MKTTKYEQGLFNALISNMRVTVIELGYSLGVAGTQRPAILRNEHFKAAVKACIVAANVSEKLDNYYRWDLLEEVEKDVMTDRHRSIIADIESIGFDFQEFLSDIVNGEIHHEYD